MKKILFILLLVSSLFANSLEWMEYDKALEMAKKEDKTIMLMIGRETCGACKYMKTVVFEDKNVLIELNKKQLIAAYVELDFDDVPHDLEYFGTPTYYFLDKDEKVIHRIDGGKTVPSFMRSLKKIN